MELAVPWYVHPRQSREWERLRTAEIGLAVVNVHNGPGTRPDSEYQDVLRGQFLARLVGYVDLDYGRRSFDQVRRDAERWLSWYGVAGLFLDQVPAQAAARNWTTGQVELLRGYGHPFVALNCGTAPVGEVIDVGDLTCVCEVDWETYQTTRWPAHLLNYPPEKQWHLVHSVPIWAKLDLRQQAFTRGAAWSWATHGTMPNPWARGWEER